MFKYCETNFQEHKKSLSIVVPMKPMKFSDSRNHKFWQQQKNEFITDFQKLRTFYVKGIQHGITRKSPVISPQMFVEFFFFFTLENLGSLSKKTHIEFDLDKL